MILDKYGANDLTIISNWCQLMALQPPIPNQVMDRTFSVDLKELKNNYTSSKFKLNSKSYFHESAKFLR